MMPASCQDSWCAPLFPYRVAPMWGLSPAPEFLRELGRRHIPIHYDVADFAADMATLRVMEIPSLEVETMAIREARE